MADHATKRKIVDSVIENAISFSFLKKILKLFKADPCFPTRSFCWSEYFSRQKVINHYWKICEPAQFQEWIASVFNSQNDLKLVCDLIIKSDHKCTRQVDVCQALSQRSRHGFTLKQKKVLHRSIQKICGCQIK
jgi:hypothetical protein